MSEKRFQLADLTDVHGPLAGPLAHSIPPKPVGIPVVYFEKAGRHCSTGEEMRVVVGNDVYVGKDYDEALAKAFAAELPRFKSVTIHILEYINPTQTQT